MTERPVPNSQASEKIADVYCNTQTYIRLWQVYAFCLVGIFLP